jgi:hypothetical protein
MLRKFWRRSIWHPDSLPPEEWKYRWLKRIWLPAYDLLAIGAGIWAAAFGSPVLHRLLGENAFAMDALGIAFAIIATVCLAGVSFPGLYRLEIAGKAALVGLLGAYAGAVVLFNANGDITSWFVAFVILMTLPLPLFRLNLLGEEIKERRNEE